MLARELAPGTAVKYVSTLRELAARLPGPLEACLPSDLAAWAAELRERGLSPQTRANRLTAAREFFAWAVDRGIVARNPAASKEFTIRRKEIASSRRWRGMRETTLETILAEARRRVNAAPMLIGRAVALRDLALVELLARGGVRASEAASARVENLSRTAGGRLALTVDGKGGKPRTVPLGKTAAAALFEWLDARPLLFPDCPRDLDVLGPLAGPVFLTSAGAGFSGRRAVERIVEDLARASGVSERVTPHTFRHTRGSEVAQASPLLARDLLGHADLNTTMTYVERSGGKLARRLEEAGVLD